MNVRFILMLPVLMLIFSAVDADVDVTVKKSIPSWSTSITAPDTAVVGEEYTMGFAIKNDDAEGLQSQAEVLELTVSGIEEEWVVFKTEIDDLENGGLASGQIKIIFPEKGDYDLELSAVAVYAVSIPDGSTSYEAFSQVAEMDASWSDTFKSYWITSIDGVTGEWSDDAKTGWSYYKNEDYAICGVGSEDWIGCPGGDALADGDEVLERFDNLEDWDNPTPVPLKSATVSVNEAVIIEEVDEAPKRRRSSGSSKYSGSSSDSSTIEIIEPVQQIIEEKTETVIQTGFIQDNVQIAPIPVLTAKVIKAPGKSTKLPILGGSAIVLSASIAVLAGLIIYGNKK